MKHADWLEVGARIGFLWPNQPWEPHTMAAAYDLFAKVDQAPALQAIVELSAGGREFAPAPGVVLARTLAIVVASTPALPDFDLIRDLTPEEQEGARLMAAALTGKKADLVRATWMEFALHASITINAGEKAEAAAARILACDGRCEVVAQRCRRPGMQSSMFPPMLPDLCAEGRQLFEAWRFSVDELRMMRAGVVQQEAAL